MSLLKKVLSTVALASALTLGSGCVFKYWEPREGKIIPNHNWVVFAQYHYTMHIPEKDLEKKLLEIDENEEFEENWIYNHDRELLYEVGINESEHSSCADFDEYMLLSDKVTFYHLHPKTRYYDELKFLMNDIESIRKDNAKQTCQLTDMLKECEDTTKNSNPKIAYKISHGVQIIAQLMENIKTRIRTEEQISEIKSDLNLEHFQHLLPSPNDLKFDQKSREEFAKILDLECKIIYTSGHKAIVNYNSSAKDDESFAICIEIFQKKRSEYLERLKGKTFDVLKKVQDFYDEIEKDTQGQIKISVEYFDK